MSKRTTILRRGRRFRAERRALCGQAPVRGGLLSDCAHLSPLLDAETDHE